MKRFYDRSSLIQPVVRICLCLIRAFVDIDACLYRILEDTLAYLAEKGATLDPATEETFLYYKNLKNSDSEKEEKN